MLYFTDTFMPQAFLTIAQAHDVPVRETHRSGQLQVTSAEESYLADGAFDPEGALRGWERAIDQARAEGYSGLRVAADMGWTVRHAPGVEVLARYEAQANHVFSGGYAMALCCYDRRLLTTAELERVAAAHPGTARGGPGDGEEWTPLLRMRRGPEGLSLSGSADRSNRGALEAMLEQLTRDARTAQRPLVIDVSGLDFADVAAVRRLRTALRAAGDRVLLRGRPSWWNAMAPLFGDVTVSDAPALGSRP